MWAKESPGASACPESPCRPSALRGAKISRTDLDVGVPREALKPSQIPPLTAVRCIIHTNQKPGSTRRALLALRQIPEPSGSTRTFVRRIILPLLTGERQHKTRSFQATPSH